MSHFCPTLSLLLQLDDEESVHIDNLHLSFFNRVKLKLNMLKYWLFWDIYLHLWTPHLGEIVGIDESLGLTKMAY